MPYASTPHQNTYPARAARKERSAARLEAEAAERRREAAQLMAEWRAFQARRDAQPQAQSA